MGTSAARPVPSLRSVGTVRLPDGSVIFVSCPDLNSLPYEIFLRFPGGSAGSVFFFLRFISRAAGLATGGFGVPVQYTGTSKNPRDHFRTTVNKTRSEAPAGSREMFFLTVGNRDSRYAFIGETFLGDPSSGRSQHRVPAKLVCEDKNLVRCSVRELRQKVPCLHQRK